MIYYNTKFNLSAIAVFGEMFTPLTCNTAKGPIVSGTT